MTSRASEIRRRASRFEARLRRTVLAALDRLEASVPSIESYIASGDIRAVWNAISGLQLPRALVADVIDETASAAIASATPDATRFGVSFNDVNDRAVRWARLNAGRLITSPTPNLAALESIIVGALERGTSPREIARTIHGIVPLTERHQAAVARRYGSIVDAGGSDAYASKIAARQANRLKRFRAEMIARTEILRAQNQGQQILWEASRDSGLLPADTRKVWKATADSRTCVLCSVLDGQEVEIGSSFSITEQATGFTPTGLVAGTKPVRNPRSEKTPPAHPNCRCTIVLSV